MKRNLLNSLISLSFLVLAGCNHTANFQAFPDEQSFQYQSVDRSGLNIKADWFANLSPELQSYYAEAKGKTGSDLFDALHKIISRNNNVKSYTESKSFMYATLDNINLNNRPGVFDAYSEVFVPGSGGDGGQYIEKGDENKDGTAGDFINCEHTWPQSFFGKSLPMVGDLHHLQATLSVPNRMRSDFPIGPATGNITYTTSGGSKLGVSSGESINTTKLKASLLNNKDKTHMTDVVSRGVSAVFEPGDQQKGGSARALLYFYLRYNDMSIRQGSFNKNNFWVSKVPAFINWAEVVDPVNEVDIARNNVIFKKQGNRNPFVDIPNLGSIIGEEVLKAK
jgi:endonuclease I